MIGGQANQVKRNVNTRAVLSRIGKVAELTTFFTHPYRAVYGRSGHQSWSSLSHCVKMGCFQMRNLRPESARGSVIDRKWTSKKPQGCAGNGRCPSKRKPDALPEEKEENPSMDVSLISHDAETVL